MAKIIPLARGLVALIDEADAPLLLQWKWHIAGPGYASTRMVTGGRRRQVYMHRLLLDAQPGQIVDHIDGNRLNNTRANLRLVTRSQNQWNRRRQHNRSGYKGVSWHRRKQKWYARIQVFGTRRFLGYFDTAQEAAVAYDAAAASLHGEYARHNGSRMSAPGGR